jgi:hypothetical protein
MAISNYFNQLQQQAAATPAPFADAPSGATQVQNTLETMLSPNSDYIRNARQRGVEFANTRGLSNSSIAAGAAERSAMEAAAPLAQQAVAIDANREQTLTDEWSKNLGFNRDMQTAIFGNSLGMLNSIQQMSLQDPALYSPDVVSGYSNFFQQNMNNVLANYFKDI